MDAPYYNGPDDREFGIDPDDERCASCGVAADEVCEAGCGCPHCRRKEWDAEDALTSETAAVGRGQA